MAQLTPFFTLANLLKMYQMYMYTGATGLLPHGFGPAGAGKTWIAEKLAEILGVQLHVINVSRLSPLEVEGIQMPINGNMDMHFLTATLWTRINPGDIVLYDEFLRGMPEIYNALLDIYTSRKVGSFEIPRSFWIGASNSIATYDAALEDRLLHMPVPDIRNNTNAIKQVAKVFVEATGMHPDMVDSMSMRQMIDTEIAPMYTLLDDLKNKRPATKTKGKSLRNLIGQVQLRTITSQPLKDVLLENNVIAAKDLQYQVYDEVYDAAPFEQLLKSSRITPIQRLNAQMHVELAGMQAHLGNQPKEDEDDDIFS